MQRELKGEIDLGMRDLVMGPIFERTSRLLQSLTRRQAPPPFYVTALVIAVGVQFIQLPGLLVAILLGETHLYSELSMLGAFSIELAFAGVLVAKMNVKYVLKNMRDHVVDDIECVENLRDLEGCLRKFWSLRRQLVFALIFGIVAGALTAVGVSQSTRHFIGIGFTISATLAWTIAVIPVYYLFQMARLPSRLSRYEYNLFRANPIRSDVLRHLSLVLKNYTYIVAVYVAVATFFYSINSPTRSLNIIVLILGWIPLTIQFVSNRSALKKISRNAKWQALREVEQQIRMVQAEGKLADKDTMEALTRLMDYHDRISATHDTALETRARISFLNQILLTVLASALANIHGVLSFLQSILSSL
jgi:hypothetical protein